MSDAQPWISDATDPEAKQHASATLRNREAITAVLRDILPKSGTVLEIASGSGEHIVHFAQAFPKLEWQPSDPDPECLRSIAAWIADSGLENIRSPLALDAAAPDWPVKKANAILCINMIHISSWLATEGLMAGAGRALIEGTPLCLYGPFRRADVATASSNEEFDRSLKSRNGDWGLRQLEEVVTEAKKSGLALEDVIDMPANNCSVIFRRNGV